MMSADRLIPQAAALPYRVDPNGRLEVLLIRRNGRDRWGVPKGIVDPGNTPAETACIESMEEAGVAGQLTSESIGSFRYAKFGGTCEVQVFPLRVTDMRSYYREQKVRSRAWFPAERAAEVVHREALKWLIMELCSLHQARGASQSVSGPGQ